MHLYFLNHCLLKQRRESHADAKSYLYGPTEGPVCSLDGGETWRDCYQRRLFIKSCILPPLRRTTTRWYQTYLDHRCHFYRWRNRRPITDKKTQKEIVQMVQANSTCLLREARNVVGEGITEPLGIFTQEV